MGKVGNRINKLGRGKREPLVLQVAGDKETIWFDFSLPESVSNEAHNYANRCIERSLAVMTEEEKNRLYTVAMVKYYASAGFRESEDPDAGLVWENADDIKTTGPVFNQLNSFILQKVMGFSILPVTEQVIAEEKK